MQSCGQNGQNNIDVTDSTQTLGSIGGHYFLQPLNRKIALALSSARGRISIDFIDSVYCNIEVIDLGGDITLSRKYKLDNDKIIFEDPTIDKKVIYSTSYIHGPDSTFFILDSHKIKLYKVYPYDERTVNLLNSENILQKDEFLYPTLNEKERIGEHFEEINGRLHRVDTIEKTDVNLYKLF